MMTCYYEIGGHSIAVRFVNEENNDDLIPSFAPFRLQDEPAELLFTMLVDDNLDWPQQNDEIGQFDCGGCNHGVYRTDNGGYLYSIHDIHDVLCSRMQSNADFSECSVSLYGKTWVQRNYGLNNALMMAYAFASALPCFAKTLVMADVNVVLPWSIWPIVPMLTCVLDLSNFCFAIVYFPPRIFLSNKHFKAS